MFWHDLYIPLTKPRRRNCTEHTKIMDAIQALATQLMREFLKHCDISDHSLEPFNQSILDIATVGEQDKQKPSKVFFFLLRQDAHTAQSIGPELSVEKKAPHLLCHQVIMMALPLTDRNADRLRKQAVRVKGARQVCHPTKYLSDL